MLLARALAVREKQLGLIIPMWPRPSSTMLPHCERSAGVLRRMPLRHEQMRFERKRSPDVEPGKVEPFG